VEPGRYRSRYRTNVAWFDLLKLKKRFEAWRKTQAKRSKTPHHLLKAAVALLYHYSAPMPSKNERQGRSANIFFFHEDSLHGRAVQ